MVFDVQYNCEFFILNPISRFWCPAKSCSEDTKGPGTTLAMFFFRIFLDLPAYNWNPGWLLLLEPNSISTVCTDHIGST
jgi:hypothetical protein